MDIKIIKSARICTGCEREFTHDEEIRSIVRVVDRQFQREDFCEACRKEATTTDAYSTWSLRYYDPKVAEAEPPEQFSPLRQVFYDAVGSEDRIELAMAYLAGQLLRRQKVFRLIKETDAPEGEPSVMLFSDRLGNRLIEVLDPDLSHTELEEGRTMLMEKLYSLEKADEDDEESDLTASETTTDEMGDHGATSATEEITHS